MLEERVNQTFPRAAGRVPRATLLCYLLSVLHAAAAVALGAFKAFGDRGPSITIGCLIGAAGFGLWIALGTGLALLAEISDHR